MMTPEQLQEAAGMWRKGLTVREMAAHFGITSKEMHDLTRNKNRTLFPPRSDLRVKASIALTAFVERGGNDNRIASKFPPKAPRYVVDEETGEPLKYYYEGKTAARLDPCGCRFPLWNHKERYNYDTDKFCGAPKVEGKPYCGFHCEAARGTGTQGERSAHRVSVKAA